MKVTSDIETSGLGDRSYVVADGGAVVMDPAARHQGVLDVVGEARVTHVLETHIHNDYVTGGLELSRAVNAEYVVPGGEDIRLLGTQGRGRSDIIVRTDQTAGHPHPGHTEHHVSYELRDGTGDPVGVFTAGALLLSAAPGAPTSSTRRRRRR